MQFNRKFAERKTKADISFGIISYFRICYVKKCIFKLKNLKNHKIYLC